MVATMSFPSSPGHREGVPEWAWEVQQGAGGVDQLRPSAAGPLPPRRRVPVRLIVRLVFALAVGWGIGSLAHVAQPGWFGPICGLIVFAITAVGLLGTVLRLLGMVLRFLWRAFLIILFVLF